MAGEPIVMRTITPIRLVISLLGMRGCFAEPMLLPIERFPVTLRFMLLMLHVAPVLYREILLSLYE
jgi:hypothetical protein